MAQIWKLQPPPPHRRATQGPPGRSPRRGGERSPSQLPLPTGSSPDEKQFYTRVIRHNPRPPGAGAGHRVTALLRGVQGCWVLCWQGSALLVIKDTRLGFGRVGLFSGYPSGSASLWGMEGRDPPVRAPSLAGSHRSLGLQLCPGCCSGEKSH